MISVFAVSYVTVKLRSAGRSEQFLVQPATDVAQILRRDVKKTGYLGRKEMELYEDGYLFLVLTQAAGTKVVDERKEAGIAIFHICVETRPVFLTGATAVGGLVVKILYQVRLHEFLE